MFLQAVITYFKLRDIYISLGEISNDLQRAGGIVYFVVLKTITKIPFNQQYLILIKTSNLRQNRRTCENQKSLSENLSDTEHVGQRGVNSRMLLKRI